MIHRIWGGRSAILGNGRVFAAVRCSRTGSNFIACALLISGAASASTPTTSSRDDDTVAAGSRSSRRSWTGDRVAVLAHVGIGAPAGALGVHLDVAPIRPIALDLGAGIGTGGLQFAAMPRLRFPLAQRTLLTAGSGVSFGRYVSYTDSAGLVCLLLCALEQNGEAPAKQTWQRAVWYNVELGADVYKAERALLRATLGFGLILNSKDYECSDKEPYGYAPGAGCNRTSGRSLLFASFYYGFDI